MGSSISSTLHATARKRSDARASAHASWAPPSRLPPSLPAARLLLLSSSAASLSAALATGAVTSEALTLASIERCHAVGWQLNAVTHELYSAALADARASDARRATRATLGPLDGVPMSLKDVLEVAGEDTTAGLATRCFKPAAEDGLLVSVLRTAGLIFICKSNVPQCLMVPESDNYIFGPSLNPWDAARTPGGSSGGEGALLAARVTPLGLGSDIGGSVRIPAAFCGVCGFKPTAGRLTLRGMPAPRPLGVDGQNAVLPTAGPMARTCGDLTLLMEVLLRDGPGGQWGTRGDVTVPFAPWSAEAYGARRRGLRSRAGAAAGGGGGGEARPLRVGVLRKDRFWEPAGACSRAVAEAAEALRAAGHSVVEWEVGVDLQRACMVYYALLAADGSLFEFKRGLEGEQLHPLYGLLNTLASLPSLIRPIVCFALALLGMTRASGLLETARSRSTRDYWALVAEREVMKNAFLEEWRANGFDVVIAPAMGVPAFLHGQSRDLTVRCVFCLLTSYSYLRSACIPQNSLTFDCSPAAPPALQPACSATFLFNLFNLPAGVQPVTRVRAGEECTYAAPAGQRDMFSAEAARALAGAEGLPVGVQVVGLPWRDEECLEAMEELERCLAAAPDAAAEAWRAGGGTPEAVLQATLAAVAAAAK